MMADEAAGAGDQDRRLLIHCIPLLWWSGHRTLLDGLALSRCTRMRELLPQMIGKSQRERYHRERRVGASVGGEHRTPSDIEVADAVHPAVGVNDPFARVAMHPGGAEMVEVALQQCGWMLVAQHELHAADPSRVQRGIQRLLRRPDRGAVRLDRAPRDLGDG